MNDLRYYEKKNFKSIAMKKFKAVTNNTFIMLLEPYEIAFSLAGVTFIANNRKEE